MVGYSISIFYYCYFRPSWHYLSNLNGSDDYRESDRYREAVNYRGICIFRFDSPLLFTNVERFKSNVHKAYDDWVASNVLLSATTRSLNLTSEKDIESADVFAISKNVEDNVVSF